MIDIAFVNETEEETLKYEEIITKVFEETTKYENITKFYEVSVIFVSQDKIRSINREYRNIDKVTDVISFALFDEIEEDDKILNDDFITTLGDIFICVDRALEQAEMYNHSLEREMGFLACHGLLHLLGYDHNTSALEEIMFKKQDDILTNLNIKR